MTDTRHVVAVMTTRRWRMRCSLGVVVVEACLGSELVAAMHTRMTAEPRCICMHIRKGRDIIQ